jgi:hypothetical protein
VEVALFSFLPPSSFIPEALNAILQELNITRQIKIALKIINQEDFIMRTSKFTKALTIALSPDDFDQIKKITDDQRISMAQFVREAIAAALANNNKQEGVTNDE